jgi:hypothetical protein
MDLTRLGFAWAATGDPPRFAIASLLARSDTTDSERDGVLPLIDALAYLADVLAGEQDGVAGEGFIDSSFGDGGALRIRFSEVLVPVAFLVVDDGHAFVIAIGADAGDSTIRFGDDEEGRRPPAGLDGVSACYGRGAGGLGNVELRAPGLVTPFALIAMSHPHARGRSVTCSLVR